jgi:hypothetical protein
VSDHRVDQAGSLRELVQRERGRILAFLDARGLRDVRVFGSVARDEDAARNDIDLLVDVGDGGSVGAELRTRQAPRSRPAPRQRGFARTCRNVTAAPPQASGRRGRHRRVGPKRVSRIAEVIRGSSNARG